MSKTTEFQSVINELVGVAERVVSGEPEETHALNARAIRALTKSLEHVHEPALREKLLDAIVRMKAVQS